MRNHLKGDIMAKCSYCGKRKAKRYCIALGSSICPLCCGTLREKEIHCPENCPYLKKHKAYQEKRYLSRKQSSTSNIRSPEEDILNDERMAWLAFNIEMALKEYSERIREFTDKDAILSLKYAEEKIKNSNKLIITTEDQLKPKNDAGEFIFQNINNCKYERQIVIPGETEYYSDEEKINCIERMITAISSFSKGNFDNRTYLQNVNDRLSKLQQF
ncbi:MAG: hypothetical protein ACOC5F_03200 [Candidatus Aminicenantaceae bacterium]